MILKHDEEYEVNDIIGEGLETNHQCTCGKNLTFDVYPDHDSISWVAECECGKYINLNSSTKVVCDIEDKE